MTAWLDDGAVSITLVIFLKTRKHQLRRKTSPFNRVIPDLTTPNGWIEGQNNIPNA